MRADRNQAETGLEIHSDSLGTTAPEGTMCVVKEEKSSEGIMSYSDDLSDRIYPPTSTQWYGHYRATKVTL